MEGNSNYQNPLEDLLESKEITKEDYKRVKRMIIECIALIFVIGIILCALALVFVVAVFMKRDGSSVSEFVASVVLCLGIGWCAWVCCTLYKETKKQFDYLNKLKEKYKKNRTEVEVIKDRKIKRVKVTVLAVIIAVIFILPIVKWDITKSKAEEVYVQAETLIWDKRQYVNAKELLESIEIDYKDKDALIAFCQAKMDVSEGKVSSAYFNKDEMIFSYQTDEHIEQIRAFKDTLDVMYDQYIEEKYSYPSDYTVVYESTTRYEPTTKYKPSYNYKSDNDDPYDIDRYRNEEDFYYDNYDNFIDYYEAEKYFKEHKDDN